MQIVSKLVVIMPKNRENFGSRSSVIMAMAGSAIGLGNIWRFPYMVGEYGGAAFILIYFLAMVFLSLPIFLAESIIGRRSHANCLGAIRHLTPGSKWMILGALSIITPTIIVSYYSVVGGWSIEYFLKSVSLSFVTDSPEQISGMFGAFISQTWSPLACFTVFLLSACAIVACGVKSGIEKFSKYAIPVLFLMVLIIIGFSLSLPGSKEGVDYLIKPDFSKITAKTCVYALGQSFYSLSLGMGIVITYSSYISKQENLFVSGVGTAIFDLLFALLAGLAIMPAVFAAGIEPGAGAGLVFETLPFIFSNVGAQMPIISSIVAAVFFLTILIAALTSAVSLLEVGVAYLIEEHGLKRGVASLLIFCITFVIGALCSLSFGPLAGVQIAGNNIFDFTDKFCSNVLLILGGLLCVCFVGWKMNRASVYDEFTNSGTKRINATCFNVIYFIIKYIAPIAVALIFISNFI